MDPSKQLIWLPLRFGDIRLHEFNKKLCGFLEPAAISYALPLIILQILDPVEPYPLLSSRICIPCASLLKNSPKKDKNALNTNIYDAKECYSDQTA